MSTTDKIAASFVGFMVLVTAASLPSARSGRGPASQASRQLVAWGDESIRRMIDVEMIDRVGVEGDAVIAQVPDAFRLYEDFETQETLARDILDWGLVLNPRAGTVVYRDSRSGLEKGRYTARGGLTWD
jgi:hypothetical protein